MSGRSTLAQLDVSFCEGVVWYYDIAACVDRAGELADEFRRAGVSTVICSGMESYPYVRAFAALNEFTVIFDMHNVELPLHTAIHEQAPDGSIFAKQFTVDHLRLLEAAERSVVTLADQLWTCSAADRNLTLATYPEVAPEKIRVVPNAIDVAAGPVQDGALSRVSFVGRLDYFPNVDAAGVMVNEIAPLLAERGIDLPVVIAGAAVADAFTGAPPGPNVVLVSDPDTVSDLIRDSIVAVPLRIGGGTRFKILEAFGLGSPVVSTPKGIEGIDAVPGVHYLAAAGPAEFAAAIARLAEDPALRSSLAEAAWTLVRERYSIDALDPWAAAGYHGKAM